MADAFVLVWNDRQFMALASKVSLDAMKMATIEVQTKAKMLVGEEGTGILYKRLRQTKGARSRNRGEHRKTDYIYHRASAPYQPPAKDTGILQGSISWNVRRVSLGIIGEVGSDIDYIKRRPKKTGQKKVDVNYGSYLELGTRDIRPRPFLRPALRKSRKKIMQIFKRAVQ